MIHFWNMCQIIVSEVGRTMSGSSSSASGSGSTACRQELRWEEE